MPLANSRKVHLELLRVLAVYLVVLTHTGKRGYTYFTTLKPSFGYFLTMLVPIICSIAVPLFYMISGANLIGKNETPEYIWKRRLPRYLLVLVLASAVMYVYYGEGNEKELSVSGFFKAVYSGNIIVPYWFMYSYVGYLMLLPFLRRLIRGLTERERYYLFGLYVVFHAIIPMLQWGLFQGSVSLNASLNVSMIMGDILIYPALGYYLEQWSLSGKQLGLLWLWALLAIAVTAYMTCYKIKLTGEVDEGRVGTFYKSLSIFPAAAVYASARKLKRIPQRLGKMICAMGECTFGVYLIEQILREEGYPICDWMSLGIPQLLATLIYTAAVVVIGMMIVGILKLIPCINKLI